MPRIVIHAGPGKTGSSAIQLWLTEHREELRAEGIYYPAHETDANGVSSGNLRRVLDRHVPGDVHVSPELVAELLAEFEETGCHTLLLSSEFFFPVLPELDQEFPNAEFIAYLRDPLEMFESNYNQGVKRHGCRVRLQVPERMPLGHIAALRRFRQARPDLRVDVRPYLDEAFVGGSLLADFLSAIGSRLEPGEERRVNPSYSPVALEFMRIANSFPLGPLRHQLDVLLQRVAPAKEPYSLIPEEKYQSLREQVSDDLARLTKELRLFRVDELPGLLLQRSQPRFVRQEASKEELASLVDDMTADSQDVVSKLRRLIEANPHVETTSSVFFEALQLTPHELISESELFARDAVRNLAERIHQNDKWQTADIAREIALFIEKHGDISLASSAMAAALELRPRGEVIRRKHEQLLRRKKKQLRASSGASNNRSS